MRDYTGYSVEDFMDDPAFRTWVLDPSGELAAFWEQWIIDNPAQSETIDRARKLLLSVDKSFGEQPGDDRRIKEGLRKLHGALEQSARRQAEPQQMNLYQLWIRVAAVLTLVAGLSWWLADQYRSDNSNTAHRITKNDRSLRMETNPGKLPKAVFLSDGSVAVLEPGTSIRFQDRFEGKSRAIYLEGEAFFDVAKDATRPFLVYADETVTRVTGTSFRVKALPAASGVSVAVKTGRVSVFKRKDYDDTNPKEFASAKGIHLVPNEQAVFDRREQRLSKTEVPANQVIGNIADDQETVFEDQPVPRVLETLSRHYNVRVLFDEPALSDCKITTGFTQETLRQRLAIICEAIDATYVFENGAVRITSAGCGKAGSGAQTSMSKTNADHDG
jgi:transmembrane sensor